MGQMEASEMEAIRDLRAAFLEKLYQRENPDVGFHPRDVERVRNSDIWLRRFLIHHEFNANDALKMLWEVCEWRKEAEVNDINESNVNVEYLKEGGLFPYGTDKDKKTMLVFRCKMHYKGQKDWEDLKRCLIYWFERLERQTGGNQITIFFDMSSTGLGNVDLEFTKYLINLNKSYYPYFLNYIIIYEMPWILNAAFRIIRSWLPARALEKIKFVDRNNVGEFVDEDCILEEWGGKREYIFEFIPEQSRKKTVHFALDSPSHDSPRMAKKALSGCDLVSITPSECIVFDNSGRECSAQINMENIGQTNILFKVRTTSPDHFRVRPNVGLLHKGHSAVVNVTLQCGYDVFTVLKDRFLILCTTTDLEEATNRDISQLWKEYNCKKPPDLKIESTKLFCSLRSNEENEKDAQGSNESREVAEKMEQLKTLVYEMCKCNAELHKKISARQNTMSWILALLVLCVCGLIFVVVMGRDFFLQGSKTDL